MLLTTLLLQYLLAYYYYHEVLLGSGISVSSLLGVMLIQIFSVICQSIVEVKTFSVCSFYWFEDLFR